MRLTASDIITLHRPTPCDLRVYLREKGVPQAEPSAFEQILQTLGQRHEEEHLATLGKWRQAFQQEAPWYATWSRHSPLCFLTLSMETDQA
jgi:hypothetical protein